MAEHPREILEFWFGKRQPGDPVPDDRIKMWFGGDSSVDEQVRSRFMSVLEAASDGKLKQWEDSPEGCLALILLYDQFARHIFRNSPDAYAFDAHALRLCLRGIDRGWDRQFDTVARVFFYLPMEHTEDLQVQKKGLDLFIRLAQEAGEGQWDFIDQVLNHAIEHHELIERFGRFPARNSVLGRESTSDELAFLSEVQSEAQPQ